MKAILLQNETAPMPKYIQSTYQTDFVSPMVRRRIKALQAIATMPPDYLDENAGKRILPTTFKEVYHNCVSASIGDRLELQFTDDTPEWKRQNRHAAALHWIRPLEERRKFIETRKSNGRGESSGGNGLISDGKVEDGIMYGNQDITNGGDVCGLVNVYVTESPGCEAMAESYQC